MVWEGHGRDRGQSGGEEKGIGGRGEQERKRTGREVRS